jgi:hypothetical protein
MCFQGFLSIDKTFTFKLREYGSDFILWHREAIKMLYGYDEDRDLSHLTVRWASGQIPIAELRIAMHLYSGLRAVINLKFFNRKEW